MNATAFDESRSPTRPNASRTWTTATRMTGVSTPERSDGVAYSDLLVRIAERRDRHAFALLFSHFAPRVKSYVARMGVPPEAAEELAQETLLTVWRRAAGFDPSRAGASTWIFTIARNLRIDASRRDRRAPSADDPSSFAQGPPSPDAALTLLENEARIEIALANLPKEQAQVIAMAYFADKPHSQIADELGLPLGTVKSRLRLAMARLRGAFTESPA